MQKRFFFFSADSDLIDEFKFTKLDSDSIYKLKL